ncbi:MAG: hypothetical protein KJ017_04955 [Alphaproteobacteria bacterium]|nr:hypothetical protein [Alphaproteobacteria bacterium]
MSNLHYDKFSQYLAGAISEEKPIGFNVKEWWEYVASGLEQQHFKANFPNEKQTRTKLKNLCRKDSGTSHIECVAAVMAWGGQNRKHGITLFNRFNEIEPIIRDMRMGSISHYEAYERFDSIWKKPQNLGMGAAYFTKLIFFCDPTHKGYIMDQWTSKSVNLLKGEEIVHLTYGYVNKSNTVDNYKNFCEFIDQLAEKLRVSGENVEIALFSKGGRKKWPWRQYVWENQNKE